MNNKFVNNLDYESKNYNNFHAALLLECSTPTEQSQF